MSNATGPLSSLADSLDSLRQRMKPTDQRKQRVLADDLVARSLAMSRQNDVSAAMLTNIRILADRVSVVDPDTVSFEQVMSDVEALLGSGSV
jgi:hypothetical protein